MNINLGSRKITKEESLRFGAILVIYIGASQIARAVQRYLEFEESFNFIGFIKSLAPLEMLLAVAALFGLGKMIMYEKEKHRKLMLLKTEGLQREVVFERREQVGFGKRITFKYEMRGLSDSRAYVQEHPRKMSDKYFNEHQIFVYVSFENPDEYHIDFRRKWNR